MIYLQTTKKQDVHGKCQMTECIHFLLTAQLLFTEASEHHEANRVISERMELDRAIWYMKSYRKCLKENR